MLAPITLGVAGILFMLGVISLQIGQLKDFGAVVSGFIILVFLACLILAGLIALAGLTMVATPTV
jgi:hypothetical protein